MAVLVRIDGYDPVAGSAVALHASSVDDDRVCHLDGATWLPAIAQLPSLRYDLIDASFSGRIETPGSTIGLVAEAWPNLPRYTLADARVRIWTGEAGGAWAEFTLRFDGRATAQAGLVNGIASLPFAVDDRWLDTPLLALYGGTTGAEGEAALKGQPKPLQLGRPRFAAGRLIDSVNSIVQLSAYGAIEDVEVAFDRLVRFEASAGDHASYAALAAATIAPGAWATAKADGMVRHGAPPAGRLAYHVRGDLAGTAAAVRLPGTLIHRVAMLVGGAGKVHEASLTALNTARPWPLSWEVKEQITAREVIQRLAASVNAVAGVSWLGKLFAAPLPTLDGAPALALDATGAALPPVVAVEQVGMEPPYWRLAIEAEPSWDVHGLNDIAFTAPLVDRGLYVASESYREGHIVDLVDGSRWLYVNATASIGNAPPSLGTSDSWWEQLVPATEAANIRYAGGETLEEMKPAQAGADVTGDNISANTEAVGGRPAGAVNQDLDQLQIIAQQHGLTIDEITTDVAGLYDTYGPTASAAASAAAALTYRDVAQAASATAIEAEGQAEEAMTASVAARDSAIAQAGAAAGSATTSAGHASNSFAWKNEAQGHAEAAEAEAVVAASARAAAVVAKDAAVSAQSGASLEASSAAMSQSLSASASLSAIKAAATQVPSTFENEDMFWHLVESTAATRAFDTYLGRPYFIVGAPDYAMVRNRYPLPVKEGRRVRITAEAQRQSPDDGALAPTSYLRFASFDDNGLRTIYFGTDYAIPLPLQYITYTHISEFTVPAAVNNLFAEVYVSPTALNGSAATPQSYLWWSILFEDITDEFASLGHANAAAGSASAAAASETAAGQQASAATSAKVAAETARGGAEAAQSGAAISQSDAAGSASSASISSGASATARDASVAARDVALGHRNDALGYANASAGSASAAAASETAAGQQASAAAADRVAAQTARGGAESAQVQAAQSESNAAGFSSSAATSSIQSAGARDATFIARDVTLGYRDAALGHANAAAGSASSAAASETAAGQQASAASLAKVAAETARGGAESAQTQAAQSESNAAGFASSASASNVQSATARDASIAARDVALGYRDVASGHAAAAQSSSASASLASAAAFSSYTSAASLAVGSINKNSNFTNTLPLQIPPEWDYWFTLASGYVYHHTGLEGPSSIETYSTIDNETGFIQNLEMGPGPYVLSATVQLLGGSFRGAGLLAQAWTANPSLGGTYLGNFWLDFAAHEPAPVQEATRPYRFQELVTLPAGTRFVVFIAVNNYTLAPTPPNGWKTIKWHRAAIRAASDAEALADAAIPALQASAASHAGAISLLEGRNLAYLTQVVNAGSGAAAFLELRAETAPGVVTSDASIGAREVHIFNADAVGLYTKAMSVTGGNVVMSGDLRVGGSITVGSRRLRVAVEPFTLNVYDGQSVSFDGDLGNTPDLLSDFSKFPTLAGGEAYIFRADNLTSTGFTARVKKTTAGSPAAQTSAAGTAGSGGPAWITHKPSAADASNGSYVFRVTGNVRRVQTSYQDPEPFPDGTYPPPTVVYSGSITIRTWFRLTAAGAWVAGPLFTIVPPNGTTATVAYDRSMAVTFGTAIGQHAAEEFGVSIHSSEYPGFDTLAGLASVSYVANTSATETTATPSNAPLLPIMVVPKNV